MPLGWDNACREKVWSCRFYRFEIAIAQRFEGNNVVQAIEQFRSEQLPHFLHHFCKSFSEDRLCFFRACNSHKTWSS